MPSTFIQRCTLLRQPEIPLHELRAGSLRALVQAKHTKKTGAQKLSGAHACALRVDLILVGRGV